MRRFAWRDCRVLGLAGAVLVGAALVGGLAARTGSAQSAPPPLPFVQFKGKLSGNGLVVASRDRLAICVQSVGGVGLDSAAGRAQVLAVLPQVVQHPKFAASGMGVAPPLLVVFWPAYTWLMLGLFGLRAFH